MANSFMNSTSNSVWVPEIIAQESLGALGAYLQLGRTVTRHSELTAASVGQIIDLPKRGVLTANAKTQNASVTTQKPTATRVQVTLNQHWEVTFGEEDFIASLQQGDAIPGYITDAVIALAEKIEVTIANLHTSLTNTVTGSGSGKIAAIADINTIRERMTVNKVPRIAPRFAYVHPSVITALNNTTPLANPYFEGISTPLTEGAVKRLYGIDFFEGQLVQATGSPVSYHSLVYTRGGFVLATRPLPQISPDLGVQCTSVVDDNGIALRLLRSYNPNELGVQITLDVLFGASVYDDRQVVEFETF